MLINCYYQGPQYHGFLPKHLDYDLEKMAEIGTDYVSMCMEQAQLKNPQLLVHYRIKVTHFINRMHKHGLKVNAVPSRWGRLIAGYVDGSSLFMAMNPDTFVQGGDPEVPADLACDPRNPKVIANFKENLKELVTTYPFDGIVWDEPRPPTATVAQFLDDMSGYVKSLRPDVLTSLFAESGKLEFAHDLAKTKNIDYLGADGHVRSEDHQMFRMKNTIFTSHAYFTPVLKAAGKKTVFLLEGQRHRDEDLANYLENIERAAALPMDQLMYYFCAHEMTPDNGQRMSEATWKAIAGLTAAKKKSVASA